LFQPKQNANIAAKSFSYFSQSQPVATHVIVPSPAAGLARKQLIATVIGWNNWNVSRPERFALAETKMFQNSFETVLFKLYFNCVDSLKHVIKQCTVKFYIFLFCTLEDPADLFRRILWSLLNRTAVWNTCLARCIYRLSIIIVAQPAING